MKFCLKQKLEKIKFWTTFILGIFRVSIWNFEFWTVKIELNFVELIYLLPAPFLFRSIHTHRPRRGEPCSSCPRHRPHPARVVRPRPHRVACRLATSPARVATAAKLPRPPAELATAATMAATGSSPLRPHLWPSPSQAKHLNGFSSSCWCSPAWPARPPSPDGRRRRSLPPSRPCFRGDPLSGRPQPRPNPPMGSSRPPHAHPPLHHCRWAPPSPESPFP